MTCTEPLLVNKSVIVSVRNVLIAAGANEFIAALILTIVFFGFGSKLEYFINSHSPFFSTLLDFFLRGKILIFMIYLTFVFALFYNFLPKKDNRFKAQLPGAAFSAVGWMVFSFFYSIYIEHFSNVIR